MNIQIDKHSKITNFENIEELHDLVKLVDFFIRNNYLFNITTCSQSGK